MGVIVKVLALLLGIMIAGLPLLAPALGSMISPFHGVMGAHMSGGIPSATLNAEGIKGEAWVVFDRYGVPHIYATTDEAGMYAAGWVTASQRLFQMDVLRRVTEGRLASLLGEKALESDKFMVMAGISDSVNKSTELLRATEPEVYRLLEAYSKGVNDYISYAERMFLLPVEYRILGQKPEPWTPRDTVAVAKLIAYMLSWNDEDLVMQHIVNQHGVQAVRLAEIFDFISWKDTLTQADCRYAEEWGSVAALGNESSSSLKPYSTIPETPVDSILSLTLAPANLLGVYPSFEASNNWVVNGSYTLGGKPIVANDPHLALTAPPIWILMEIQTPSYKSIGALFPGTPLIVIGRNEHVAWAFTNLMGDFTDYYYYKWNDKGEYLYKGQWLSPEKTVRTVKVWDPVKRTYTTTQITVEKTVHGYLVRGDNEERLAVRWTGQDATLEIVFFFYLNNATSVKEALAAQRYFRAPIQNFIVGDDQGNFAYSPFGAYPVRTNLPSYNISGTIIVNKGFLPFNGSNGEGEWAGYYNYTKLPVLYNPPLPYIVTANSKPWNGSCGNMTGWHYHDKYRLERIEQLLDLYINMRYPMTWRENAAIQLDQFDLGVKDYVGKLLILANNTNSTLLEKVSKWYSNYVKGYPLSPYSSGQTLAIAWLFTFHKNLWTKIYGGEEHIWFFRAYYALHFIDSYQNGDPLAKQLLDNETLEELAGRSLEEAAHNLALYYGTWDTGKWTYGKLHYYKPSHLAFRPMDLPYMPAGGATWTVNVAPIKSFSPDQGMPVDAGPSIRMVVDLSTKNFMIQLPGGESGSPFSKHYFDLYMCCWLRSTYVVYTLGMPANYYGKPSLHFMGEG